MGWHTSSVHGSPSSHDTWQGSYVPGAVGSLLQASNTNPQQIRTRIRWKRCQNARWPVNLRPFQSGLLHTAVGAGEVARYNHSRLLGDAVIHVHRSAHREAILHDQFIKSKHEDVSHTDRTIVVDGNVPPGRLPKAPVTLQIKDGVIVDFEGSEDADALRAYFAESGDPIATHLCHFTLGLNPRARTSGSVHQDEHVLGAVTFGFGSQAPAFGGTVPPCNVHCDVVLTTAKIECDGRIMLEANKLNEEMGFGGLS